MRIAVLAALFVTLAAELPAQFKTMFPAVRGTREMVGAANNQEVEAGFRILLAGGNAVDAGVAATLAAAVTEQARFGIGGEMPLLIKMKGQPVVTVAGVGPAPAKATFEFYRDRKPEPWEDARNFAPIPSYGILATTVPGVFDGLILALERYGTLSFARVVEPAIEYAENGFPLGEEFAAFLGNYQSIIERWPASKTFFLPNGTVPNEGDVFRAPTLAATLRELAAAERKQRGSRSRKLQAVRDYFYRGPLAKRIAAFSEQNGGLLSYTDLANFRAEIDEPRKVTYRGYEVYKAGFWTQGPMLLQTLNILEGYDLKAMGHNTAEYLHTVAEAAKLAYADRDRYYGDPKFSEIPEQILLSKDYAVERRALIDPDRASLDHRPGDFGGPLSLTEVRSGRAGEAQDTTCVNVVDRWGNVFSATPSGAWLPSVIAGDTGVPLGSRLQSMVMIPGHANQLAPGKRPRVTLTPTIVLKDGEPFLAMSTPGGDNQDQTLLQTLLNIVEFGMPPQQAVEAPRFQTGHLYGSFGQHNFSPGSLTLEARILGAAANGLRARGHRVRISGPWANPSAPVVIQVGNGILDGGADPRRARFIFGR
ncbi:MAG: gamma-glutamyltransferase family protein [Bryobacterales bacterium]|nr:gamma-glutamyltransferase family protein [Bryobacterales bacterium]